MAEITIKGVEGNPLNINVVMNEILHHLSDGVMETETVDFYPDTTKPVRAYLDSVTARRQYCPSVAVSGNTVYLSANNVTAGVYTLTIICTDTNGKTRRFKSDACIEIYDITRAAEVAEEFDSEQYTINGVFYTFMTQSDWDEVNPASPAYILNKPDLTEYATKEDIETIEGEIPVIPEWAQQPQKPTYTAGEVGAVPTSRTVNGKALSEDITLNAQDVGAQTPIADLAQIREGAAKGATAYQKPSNGMPKTDLAVSVQQSLDKADTAYQKPSAGIPKTDFAQEIQDRLNIPIDEIPTAGSNNLVKSGGVQNELALGAVYDVSAKNPTAGPNNDGKFESLSALLSDANLNTLIPTAVRKGGMSIKFVQSSDNKYVQYRLTKDEWSVFPSDWIEADSNKVEDKVLYVTDGSGNIIAKIDKDGVHSVDFKIGSNGDSVVEAINGISGQISSAVNAEKLLREQGDTTVTGLVEAEEARAKTAEDTKLNYTIIDDKFCITDANGYIICQIDASGVNSVDVKVKVDDELVSVKTLIDKKLDQTLDSSTLEVTDSNGYIVARIDKDGIHSAKDKHAVACMVLSESYYPTAAPTRDSDGNVTYAQVMFETGIAGSISITYTNGNSSSVAVVYGDYNYTIIINRDSDGNVETVNVQ